MKKLLIALIFIFLTINAFAVQVSYEEASKTAAMKLQVSDQKDHTITDIHEMTDEQGEVLAYIFELAPVGFIATSTNTDIDPIIAYSFRNNFSMEKSYLNQGYIFLEEGMKLRHDALELIPSEVKNENNEMWQKYLSGNENYFLTRDVTWPPDEYGSNTGGWIEIEWNQNPNPYYTFCPMDPGTGSRCVVGCVATAMAQVMYFHRYIGNPVFNNSDSYWSTYTSPTIHIDNDHDLYDFPSFSELNPHLSDLSNAFAVSGEITDDMISAINFAAGVSVEMGYSSEGSGAYMGDVASAYLYKFDYDTAQYTTNINTTFYTNLQNNLTDAKPVLFGIAGSQVGHAIICDGWNETDNTYHLNMGWGGQSNGWYTLPYGMPAGYNQIVSAILNLDGGEPFIDVSGQVVAIGADLTQTVITLEGPRNYEIQVSDPGGFFNIPWVKGGIYQATAIIELNDGGYFYKTFEIELNESNSSIAFILDSYETIDGSISASISTENTSVAIYDGNQIVRMGLADASGNYTVPGLLPGDYHATASLNSNFFDEQPITITAANQTFDFNCLEFEYDHIISFYGDPTDQYELLPEMGVGIKISGANLIGHDDDAFAKMAFLAPFNPDQGDITAQIWDGSIMVTEKLVIDFSEGNWKTVVFDNFVPINTDKEYYVGYLVSSFDGILPATYHDDGPRIEGGAYIRIGGNWTPLNSTAFNFNFCIQGIAISTSPSGADEEVVPISTNILNENYPNPFNPSTTISYNLIEDSNVELSIYNLKGQKVKQLVKNHLSAGQHSVNWNGTDNNGKDVSSGIYLYKLKVGNHYTSTKKMILLK